MGTYVLIALLVAGPMNSYTSLATAHFNTKDACEQAVEFIKGGESRIRRIACLPTGEAQ